jgi:DNA-binding MarR family transcriptional regulator
MGRERDGRQADRSGGGRLGPHDRTPISFLFQLFVTHHRVRALLNRTMAGAPLRPDEYAVYSAVFRAGPLSVSDLARLLGMPLTTVSEYLQTMSRRGHVDRVRNPADNRSYLVSLTPDGTAAHTASQAAFTDAIDRVRGALDLPEREVAEALAALDVAVRAALDDVTARKRAPSDSRTPGG